MSVQSLTHLVNMPRADTALDILKKTATLVKPIMRKHNWDLPVLAEFFPDNPSLYGLNINMGQKILLRLRYANSPDSFLSIEDIVGTMLHELTHNIRGPHDDQFYKLLSGLQDEYDDLRRSGYAGEGFYSPGRRLGENTSHNVPQYVGRLKALEAAESRRKKLRIANGGGTLGGRNHNSFLSPREMAVRAAEQRARDEKSCASGVLAQQEAEKAAKASIETKVIDLTLDDDYSDIGGTIVGAGTSEANSFGRSEVPEGWSCRACTFMNPSTTSLCDMCDSVGPQIDGIHVEDSVPTPMENRPTIRHLDETSDSTGWTCTICTFLNLPSSSRCDICDSVRSKTELIEHKVARRSNSGVQDVWTCSRCTLNNLYKFWSCAGCGMIKTQS